MNRGLGDGGRNAVMDGKIYGPDLGPDGTALEQFAFIYKPE